MRRPTVSRADYLETLVETFGFVAPLESACRYTHGLDRSLDIRQLTRAGLIAQDLVALGMLPSLMTRVPQCAAITTFGSVAEALGWLYVIERLAVVADGVRSTLVERIPDIEHGCSFLEATEGRAHERLAWFGDLLEHRDDSNEIVAAACDAFACAQR